MEEIMSMSTTFGLITAVQGIRRMNPSNLACFIFGLAVGITTAIVIIYILGDIFEAKHNRLPGKYYDNSDVVEAIKETEILDSDKERSP